MVILSKIIVFKIDAFVEGKTGPKVEYEVYYPFDSNQLNLLDLSKCEGEEIFIGDFYNDSKFQGLRYYWKS